MYFRLKEASGLEYSDMIYFDDDATMQPEIEKLGVYMVLTPGGVNKALVRNGLKEYSTSGLNGMAAFDKIKELKNMASLDNAKNRLTKLGTVPKIPL